MELLQYGPVATVFDVGGDFQFYGGAVGVYYNTTVCGNNEESLFGVCESMYKPDLEPEELFEVIAQCILAGVNRDCLSGWGGVVHVISKDKVITRTLKGRMD